MDNPHVAEAAKAIRFTIIAVLASVVGAVFACTVLVAIFPRIIH